MVSFSCALYKLETDNLIGGDNIFQKKTEFTVLDTQDEVLTQYIKSQTPVKIKLEGRILNVNGTVKTQPAPSSSGTPAGTSTGSPAPSATTSLGSLTKTVGSSLALLGAFAACVCNLALF